MKTSLHNFKFFCIVLGLLVLFTTNLQAADRYAVATGNWNATSTWSATSGGSSGASAPVAGDNVFIEGGRTVTIVNTGGWACANLTIGTATSGTLALTDNSNLTFAISGNITIASGSTLQIGNSPGSRTHTISLQGNLTNSGTLSCISPDGSDIIDFNLNGSSAQSIGGNSTSIFNNLTINNGFGITLNSSVNVSGLLTLTNGLLTTTTSNLLTIAAGGSTSGASNSSFVNGPMAKVGTTLFTFPVGKSGAGLRTIGISAPTPSTTFTAEFIRGPAPSRGLVSSGITQVSFCEYWTLARSGSANVSVTLSWTSASPCNSALYVTSPTDLRVARWNGANWVDQGGSGVGTALAGTITSSTVSDFSNLNFALGSANAAENPLPVKFTDIKAYEKGNGVQIEWTNQTESDMVNYEVEKSVNGRDFTSINNIAPRSNMSNKESYIGFDASPANGSNFYRIKANESTGKSVYSNIVKVVKGQKQIELIVYPNPVTGSNVIVNFNAPTGRYNVELFNAAGQRVLGQQLNHQGGTVAQMITLPAGSKAGMYSLRIIGENYKASKMLIVQ